MKPLIGVTSYYVDKDDAKDRNRGLPGQDMSVSSLDYLRSVKSVGGTPASIPVINDEDFISEVASRFDGFLFSGGPDLDPKHYGESLKMFEDFDVSEFGKIVPKRDSFELKLLEKVIKKDKPVLGICRGMQLLNVFYDGTLKQDLREVDGETNNHIALNSPKWYPIHDVKIEKGSEVWKAYKKEEIRVNSFHHQIVDIVGEDLKVTARSSDSLIEAIEDTNKKFVVGIQWHPEMMTEKNSTHLKIFKEFVKSIKN